MVSGKLVKPQRVLLLGTEGSGKSSLAAEFAGATFQDIEGSTEDLDIHRQPDTTSYTGVCQNILALTEDHQGHGTLVIDTIDKLQQMIVKHVCDTAGLGSEKGLADFDHGKGYVRLAEEFARFLDALTLLSERQNMHIVLIAHSVIRKFELPDESGSYDRWELNLERKVAQLPKGWARMILFLTYQTFVVKQDGGTNKAQGGKRVIKTSHHPCYDAKNRCGLPDELPFGSPGEGFAGFSAHVHSREQLTAASQPPPPEATPASPPVEPTTEQPQGDEQPPWMQPLIDLAKRDGMCGNDIRMVVESYTPLLYPIGTTIVNYGREFVEGRLVPGWEKIKARFKELKGVQQETL